MATVPIQILFANTGVQFITIPLGPELQYPADQTGSGWQYCRCKVLDKVTEYGYVQWQMLRRKLVLAVDTTLGPDDATVGYFAQTNALGGDFVQKLTGLLGVKGAPLAGLPPIEFMIRPATAVGGEPREVHVVVDFGNSRTGVLLVEFRGDSAQEPLMTPLLLHNRYHLDVGDEPADAAQVQSSWWFSSRSHWSTPPYLSAPKLEKTVYRERKTTNMFGRAHVEQVPVTVFESPRTFEDFSMVRMGREADDLAGVIFTEGEIRTGVSSPKRYLWARDASWLEGANWQMADPFDRYDPEHHATPLKGPFLRFFPEDDTLDNPAPNFEEAPARPQHAPRTLMIGALYEILCQAFTFVNSPGYRRNTGVERMRLMKSLTLTYPSGMIPCERAQLQKQAYKAIRIFMQTLGKNQPFEPELELSLDEASAVHLTYIWSEVLKLGRKPKLWFSVMGRQPRRDPSAEAAAAQPPPEPVGRAAGRPGRLGRRGPVKPQEPQELGPEVRIACIDIGGGTTDLMIAKYSCTAEPGGNLIRGETLHRDGITLAGDHLVKRLLEQIIVPQFVDAIGLDLRDAQLLFGREVPATRAFRSQRIHWMNRLFVPLAHAYLEHAVDEGEESISHTDANLVAPEVLQSLQAVINRIWGPGVYNVNQDLGLCFNRDEFDPVADEVFGDLLFDFCESIVEHKADVVLLAGQPSKLRYIQKLVESYLPLPTSRIIPMYCRYAGTWYPYQSPDSGNPGVIVDPKSTVVVGAAIEFSARHGMLSQFRFRMSDTAAKKSYYWGVMTESRIDVDSIVFDRHSEGLGTSSVERMEVDVAAQNLFIGRKRRERENAQASPVYLLKVVRGKRLGEINVRVNLERKLGPEGEEELVLESVTGEVDGEPAVQNRNVLFEWRTLADERYFLDTGGLDKLELE
ncbi:MAG: virulence factor SrfB [Planctomycetota bacterium]|nr:virulence factor SrfB [Planctomycetota bacterium]